jgi:hypothetical protein
VKVAGSLKIPQDADEDEDFDEDSPSCRNFESALTSWRGEQPWQLCGPEGAILKQSTAFVTKQCFVKTLAQKWICVKLTMSHYRL